MAWAEHSSWDGATQEFELKERMVELGWEIVTEVVEDLTAVDGHVMQDPVC
jgi:hypothetical protein